MKVQNEHTQKNGDKRIREKKFDTFAILALLSVLGFRLYVLINHIPIIDLWMMLIVIAEHMTGWWDDISWWQQAVGWTDNGERGGGGGWLQGLLVCLMILVVNAIHPSIHLSPITSPALAQSTAISQLSNTNLTTSYSWLHSLSSVWAASPVSKTEVFFLLGMSGIPFATIFIGIAKQ